MPVRSVAVHSPCDADDSLPSVDVIRAAQRKAVADLGDNLRSFPTTFGQVTLADDDLFRVRVGNRHVLWIRVLERLCLARMATRYMILRLERLSKSIFCMSAAVDLKVVRVCLKRMDFVTSW